jgi:hypothetical protein
MVGYFFGTSRTIQTNKNIFNQHAKLMANSYQLAALS